MGGARPNSGRGGGGSYSPPVKEESVAAPQPVVQQEAPRYTEPQRDESRVDPAQVRFQQEEENYQRAINTQREQQAAAQREMDNQNAMYSQNALNNAPQSIQQLNSLGSLTRNSNNPSAQGMPTSPSRFSRRSTKGKGA
jgi:hypothetical protein